jgi:hypothetical protein
MPLDPVNVSHPGGGYKPSLENVFARLAELFGDSQFDCQNIRVEARDHNDALLITFFGFRRDRKGRFSLKADNYVQSRLLSWAEAGTTAGGLRITADRMGWCYMRAEAPRH